MPDVPTHYLRPNDTNWSPASVAFFDTETTPVKEGDDELHVLRLWCGDAVRRDPEGRRRRDGAVDQGHSAESLAAWVQRQCVGVSSTWVFAHNLSFDLVTTRLLDHLAATGWAVSQFGSTDRCPWFRLRRASKRLVLTDSWSWLSTSLERIGRATGTAKPALPDWADTDDQWFARCRGDVATLADAVLSLMDWWDRERLGRWSITGASTGWNAFRHRMAPPKMLVRPDPEPIAFERRAVRGGRRDAWRFGDVPAGRYLELDIERAHGTTAEHFPLPWNRLCHVDSLPNGHKVWTSPHYDALVEARVRCRVPRWPLRATGATWWPTGDFWTVLAGPELRRARELGDLADTGPGFVYLVGQTMRPWAEWINRVAGRQTPTAPPAAALAAKSWSRSVIGKWAGHKSETTWRGTALRRTWGVENVVTGADQPRTRLVTLGDDCWKVEMGGDADNCFPAVLAWVESYERVAMQTMITTLGQRHLVSCDTDGMIVDLTTAMHHPEMRARGGLRLRRDESRAQLLCEWLSELVAPYRVRPKSLVASVSVAGPQQLTLDGRHHRSGIPKTAEAKGPDLVTYRAWPKLWWQVRREREDGYVRPSVTVARPVNTVHRWVLEGGRTKPVRAELGEGTEPVLLSWGMTQEPGERLHAAVLQHQALERRR